MRASTPVVLALALFTVQAAAAQSAGGLVATAGVGGTYYCIVSRCDTGTTLGIVAGVDATKVLSVEAGVRRHHCFDCDRFLIAESAVLLQLRRRVITPFVAGGVNYSSDPNFMGDHFGLLAATGASVWFSNRWGIRIELRGRQVGRGDAMGEMSASVTHRFTSPTN